MLRWIVCAVTTVLLTSIARPASAQSSAFQPPVAGVVYHQASRTVRGVLGLPGAWRLGPPVMNEVDGASVAPDGKWAWILKSGRSAFIHGLSGGAPVDVSAGGLIDNVDRVTWSRDGSSALLYSTALTQLQRVRLAGA